MISTAIFLSLISFALALPTGSPICRKNGKFTSHHGANPDTSAPFKATAVAGKDLTATISIKGKFAGLLLYVNKVNSQSNIGAFKSQNGFAYVPECDSGNESTLTHKDSSQKGDTSFVWTAPEAGSYVVNAIVAGSAVQWNEFSIKIDVAGENAVAAVTNSNQSAGVQQYETGNKEPEIAVLPTDSYQVIGPITNYVTIPEHNNVNVDCKSKGGCKKGKKDHKKKPCKKKDSNRSRKSKIWRWRNKRRAGNTKRASGSQSHSEISAY